jgi:hypothetical protein
MFIITAAAIKESNMTTATVHPLLTTVSPLLTTVNPLFCNEDVGNIFIDYIHWFLIPAVSN